MMGMSCEGSVPGTITVNERDDRKGGERELVPPGLTGEKFIYARDRPSEPKLTADCTSPAGVAKDLHHRHSEYRNPTVILWSHSSEGQMVCSEDWRLRTPNSDVLNTILAASSRVS